MTLTDLCREARNYFDVDRRFGQFEIKDGNINLDFLCEGQYFRIIGSVFNDGVHKYGETLANDEKFNGAVWALAIPQDFMALCDEITAFEEKLEEQKANDSGYASESWGGYSYSMASSVPAYMTEQKAAIDRKLNSYRKAFVL